jgi:Uma2 family endonuclease
LLELNYFKAAQEYLRRLPPEHFMEATPQATQREITLESVALVQAQRPDVHKFNELLVQYPLTKAKGKRKIGQVVPDNMVVLYDGPIKAQGSYDIPLQPVGPFLVLEYVSKNSERKDYDENMRKYEHDLKVPYYLLFQPEAQELTLYYHTGEKYNSVPPNEHGRHPISQLELEVALREGWVRYWFRGELLPLPADLLHERDAERQARQSAERMANEERQRADLLAAEVERLRQELTATQKKSMKPPPAGNSK